MYGVVGSYPDAYEGLDFRSPVAYHALKGGTVHLTRHLAVYWAQDNVRVNCLSPGPFPKEMVSDEVTARLSAKNPMKRMGRPYELKGALLLLASDAGSYITGQNILVEGGWTAW
jgi:gluconate 5-dehydrogenase